MMGRKKKDEEVKGSNTEEEVKEEETTEATEKEDKDEKVVPLQKGAIRLEKYFQVCMPEVVETQKAYLVARYRGKRMTQREWSQELKQHFK